MTTSPGTGPDTLAPSPPLSSPGPDAVRAEVARLRAGVLGGRGPGASRSEFLEHTRARSSVGAVPVPELRAQVARAAAAAGEDVERLSLEVAADRARLHASLGTVRSRLRPARVRSLRARVAGFPWRRGAGLSALATAAVVIARRRSRPRGW